MLFVVFVYSCVPPCDSLFLGSIIFFWFVAVDWGGLQ